MDEKRRLICASRDLEERGKGVRFEIAAEHSAFAVRYRGRVYAYLNRCAHISVELDWAAGEFFDFTGSHLICATHGALYAPDSGKCLGGPCHGGGLTRLEVEEIDGNLYLIYGPENGNQSE